MAQGNRSPGETPRQIATSLALANLIGQTGCLTLVLILVALGAGLWLDDQLQTRPLFTLGLVLGSIPVTMFLTARMALRGVARMQPPAETAKKSEEGHGGEAA